MSTIIMMMMIIIIMTIQLGFGLASRPSSRHPDGVSRIPDATAPRGFDIQGIPLIYEELLQYSLIMLLYPERVGNRFYRGGWWVERGMGSALQLRVLTLR